MLFLSKEMEESVKNEIVLHPPNSNAQCPQEQGYLGVLRGAMREGTDIILLFSMFVGFHLTQIITGIK